MPDDNNFKDFLKQNDLQKYHSDFVHKLGVTAVDHLTYVQSDDVKQLGMSQPEWRRLRASMKKLKKKSGKSGKDKSNKGGNMAKPGHEPAKQTSSGGHIIPASSLDILDRELGRGEFGKVMQGIWTNSEDQKGAGQTGDMEDLSKIQVAIKCLSPEKVSIDKHQQDFLKEAAIMYSLNHEHLVKLFGVVLDVDSSLMLVTEFAPLRSLAENIKQEALKASFPVTLLVDFSVQIADAMRYLHSSNIIHRDLATRNILLFINEVGTKTVKISDFGLSRRLLLGENYRSEMKPHLKLPLAWMPVEALTKLTFTKASDVYSFGVTMWEMFSYGCQPWATRSGEEILKAIDKPNFQRLERPEACPKPVYEIMLRCWSHQAEDRPTFAELHSDLPMTKPQQVRAVSSHVASSPDELTFRTDDIITVIESGDKSGMWTGVSPLGKVGKFECTKTSAVGGGTGPTSPSRDKKGSKVKRSKSGKTKEVKKSSSSGGINKIDIGAPKNYQHIFHVGPDGQVEGDPTFGGTDYSKIPVTSTQVEKSPQTKRILRPKHLPPAVPPAGDQDQTDIPPHQPIEPRKASPEAMEPLFSVEASAPQYMNQVEASPDLLHGTSDVADGYAGKENNHNSLVYQNGKDSPTSPDEFSSFEMGSLLEECLSAWESVDSQLKMRDSARDDEETNGLEGEGLNLLSANRTKNNNSNVRSSPISINQGGRSREVGVGSSINFHDANDTTHFSSGGMATPPPSASSSSHPDTTLNLHNMIIKDRICTQRETKRFVPSRLGNDSDYPKGPSTAEGHLRRHHSESSGVSPRSESPPSFGEDARHERRWRTEFKRLSSTTPQSDCNEYLENLGETPPSPVDDNSVTPSTFADSTTEPSIDHERPVKRPSKGRMRTDYEELSLAVSPDPGTYTFKFNSQQASNVSRSSSMKEAGIQPVSPDIQRSQSFRSDVTEEGLSAYDMLIGGDISGSKPERIPPVVPPKPSRMNFVEEEEEVVWKRQSNSTNLDQASHKTMANSSESSDHAIPFEQVISAPISGHRESVRKLMNRFEPSRREEVPPLPPREPVSRIHQVTSQLRPPQLESLPSRASPHNDHAKAQLNSPAGSPLREQNNNETVYRLSAETLEKLPQEQHDQSRRRRSIGEARRRRRSNTSETSDQSPVKSRHSTSEEEEQESPQSDLSTSPKPSPVKLDLGRSPQRRKGLPDLPENDQTNRPHNLHTTPPLPPRKPPSLASDHPLYPILSVNLELAQPSPPIALPAGETTKLHQDVAATTNLAAPPSSMSPSHRRHPVDGNEESDFQARASPISSSPCRTPTSNLQDTMKSLATLSPRSSPRHSRREAKDLPNCYAQESDGLDLPPSVPLIPAKRNSKKRVPPRPPPRKPPHMQRSKTVEVKTLAPELSRKTANLGMTRSHTVSNDVDLRNRSHLKSAVLDRCIIDQEESFNWNPPVIPSEEDDGEPDYPPPPIPLEEPTIMMEKHIAFRKDLLPDPLSPEVRERIVKTLEKQNSVPLSLKFDHSDWRERSGSGVSRSSSVSSTSYVSPRSSVVNPIGLTPVKHLQDRYHSLYDTPRKVSENQLLRYNISTTLENRVRFSSNSSRHSTGSDIVRELDYEILVIQKGSSGRDQNLESAYESMRAQTSAVRKLERYINARTPIQEDPSSTSSLNDTDPAYADMNTRALAARQDVRRVRSMEDLLGSDQREYSSRREDQSKDQKPKDEVEPPSGDPPLGYGHVFETPGYMKMKSSANRSASVCVLSHSPGD